MGAARGSGAAAARGLQYPGGTDQERKVAPHATRGPRASRLRPRDAANRARANGGGFARSRASAAALSTERRRASSPGARKIASQSARNNSKRASSRGVTTRGDTRAYARRAKTRASSAGVGSGTHTSTRPHILECCRQANSSHIHMVPRHHVQSLFCSTTLGCKSFNMWLPSLNCFLFGIPLVQRVVGHRVP